MNAAIVPQAVETEGKQIVAFIMATENMFVSDPVKHLVPCDRPTAVARARSRRLNGEFLEASYSGECATWTTARRADPGPNDPDVGTESETDQSAVPAFKQQAEHRSKTEDVIWTEDEEKIISCMMLSESRTRKEAVRTARGRNLIGTTRVVIRAFGVTDPPYGSTAAARRPLSVSALCIHGSNRS